MRKIYFTFLLLIIATVSAVDAYLNQIYPIHYQHEENPMARLVLELSHNDIPLLISLKLLGTSIAIGFLSFLYFHKQQIACTATAALAIIQCSLLLYILLATSG